MATRKSEPRRRATYPTGESRISNQVGSPWMLEGKTFFPEQGTPVWKTVRRRTMFAVWLPVPFTVPTRMTKSFTTVAAGAGGAAGAGVDEVVGMASGDLTATGGGRRGIRRCALGGPSPQLSTSE